MYQTVVLSEQNGWKYTWKDLEKASKWTVREKTVPDGYTSRVTQEGNLFIITNTKPEAPKPEEPEEMKVSKTVIKLWNDNGYETERPASVTAELLHNGQIP